MRYTGILHIFTKAWFVQRSRFNVCNQLFVSKLYFIFLTFLPKVFITFDVNHEELILPGFTHFGVKLIFATPRIYTHCYVWFCNEKLTNNNKGIPFLSTSTWVSVVWTSVSRCPNTRDRSSSRHWSRSSWAEEFVRERTVCTLSTLRSDSRGGWGIAEVEGSLVCPPLR